MIYLIDSCIVRHLVARDEGWENILMNMAGNEESTVFSSICVQELVVAAMNYRLQKDDRAYILQIVNSFHVMPFDERAAEFSARVETQQRKAGKIIGKADILIAGHALGLQATLITNNEKDFSRVIGLETLNWLKY